MVRETPLVGGRTDGIAPPTAPRRPAVLRHNGDERVDDWYWLRDRENPEVIGYLEAENAFTQAALAPTEGVRTRIFDEIVARVEETDVSAPVRKDGWEYYTRTRKGLQYGLHCRRPAGTDEILDPLAVAGEPSGEELLLDENALAAGSGYFALGGFAITPRHDLLAYSVDLNGSELYTLRFRGVSTGSDGVTSDLPDEVPDTYYGLAWANDGATIFYTRPDEAMRPYQVWRHRVGTPSSDDVLVFEDPDERYYVSVDRTRTGRYIVVTSASKLTTEVWFVDADTPAAELHVVAPREEGVEYHVEHHESVEGGDRFYVLTNAGGAENFELLVTPVATPGRGHWTTVVAHRPDVRLEDVDAFAHHLVLSERRRALEQIHVLPIGGGGEGEHVVEMPEEVYSVWTGANPQFDTSTWRLGYTSLVAPASDYDYDVTTRTMTLVKQQPVHGYDPRRLETHRIWATATDGTEIPISLVYPRGLPLDGSAPFLLYGYGSYEVSIDPTFSTSRLSLLERGCGFAIAHVRGGGELGRHWYEEGKFEHKANTFTDFIACAEHLVARGYTAPSRLAARGGSAGGLLMGAIANLRPDLFRAVVAEVPFVDCLTTILDPSLPLTITEWEEWGNPATDALDLRGDEGVHPLRQRQRPGVPGPARHGWSQRPACPVLGAREVGGEAPGDQDRRPSARAEDGDGRRPFRPVGPVRRVARRGLRPRVRRRPARRHHLIGSPSTGRVSRTDGVRRAGSRRAGGSPRGAGRRRSRLRRPPPGTPRRRHPSGRPRSRSRRRRDRPGVTTSGSGR